MARAQIPRIDQLLDALSARALEQGREVIDNVAQEGADKVRTGIRDQVYATWPPLAPATVAKKRRKGLDARMLIATKHYVRSFRVRSVHPDLREVGISENAVAWNDDGEPTTTPLRLVGLVHEYGSHAAKVPARPHVRPVLALLRRKYGCAGAPGRVR